MRGASPRTREGRNGPTVQTAVAGGQWPVVSGQWPGTAGAGAPRSDARAAGDTQTRWHGQAGVGDRLETRAYGGFTSRSLAHQLGTRSHGGIAAGGRCGGCPPAQGRAGTARPSKRQWPVVSGQWPGTAGAGAPRSDARAAGDTQTRWHGQAGEGDRLEARAYGGFTSRSLAHQLGTRSYGGIAAGGRCGGCPPAQGRAGTARPSKRRRMVVRNGGGLRAGSHEACCYEGSAQAIA